MKKLMNPQHLARTLLMLTIGVGGAALLSACDRNEGPMEEMGESMDQGFENAKDSYNEGVEEVQDEIDDHTTE